MCIVSQPEFESPPRETFANPATARAKATLPAFDGCKIAIWKPKTSALIDSRSAIIPARATDATKNIRTCTGHEITTSLDELRY